MSDSYEVKIPLFEGPFDLLLFFIRRDELDIHDIPISKITKDFLDYIKHLEALNMEVASEFILVAATLMRIKAKMLLPRQEVDEEGNEIDPREDLIKHLLEYKKYKAILGELEVWETNSMQREKRGNIFAEIRAMSASSDAEAELQSLDMYKLLRVYQKVMKRFEIQQNKPVHQVVPYPYKVEDQRALIMQRLENKERISFLELIEMDRNRIALIFNFLAVLELLAWGELEIVVGEGFNNFWVSKKKPEDQVVVETRE
jgi:segregation and condensation protein A